MWSADFMATSEYVVTDGELFKVVKSHEKIELDQVQAEVNAKQAEYDQVVSELVDTPTDAEALLAVAKRRDEAKVALEDSKSDYEVATGVVEAATAAAGSVHVDVSVESPETEF